MLRATPAVRTRFLAFQERARSAFIAFDTHAHAHPRVERFCGPVKIYREEIDRKIHRVFAVLRNEQEKIPFPDLKKAISKELGFSTQQTYRQIIGDSSAFSRQGTLVGAQFLASRLNPVIENSIVLYGFTGSNKTSGVTMDVNALTSAWIKRCWCETSVMEKSQRRLRGKRIMEKITLIEIRYRTITTRKINHAKFQRHSLHFKRNKSNHQRAGIIAGQRCFDWRHCQ